MYAYDMCVFLYYRFKSDDNEDDEDKEGWLWWRWQSKDIFSLPSWVGVYTHTCFINLILIVIVVAGGSLSGEKNN